MRSLNSSRIEVDLAAELDHVRRVVYGFVFDVEVHGSEGYVSRPLAVAVGLLECLGLLLDLLALSLRRQVNGLLSQDRPSWCRPRAPPSAEAVVRVLREDRRRLLRLLRAVERRHVVHLEGVAGGLCTRLPIHDPV